MENANKAMAPEAPGPELQALQQKLLEILDSFADICRRHGLRFVLEGGTCLGAIRHQDFIPWDDDIDVGMPRQDYERFRALADAELPRYHLAAQDSEYTEHNCRLLIKLHDTRTTYVRGTDSFPDMWHGVNIDIFPFDGYPEDEGEARRMQKKLRALRRLDLAMRLPQPHGTLMEKVKYGAAAALRRLLPLHWAYRQRRKCTMRYTPEECKNCFTEVFGKLYIYPSDFILRTELRPFAGRMLPCPVDYDTYLTIHYGNWRELPPESERQPHHEGLYISLDKSYLDRWWEKESP